MILRPPSFALSAVDSLQYALCAAPVETATSGQRVSWGDSYVSALPVFRDLCVPKDRLFRPLTLAVMEHGAYLLSLRGGEWPNIEAEKKGDQSLLIGASQLTSDETSLTLHFHVRHTDWGFSKSIDATMTITTARPSLAKKKHESQDVPTLHRGEVAKARLFIHNEPTDQFATFVATHTWATRPKFENQGLSMGLALLSNAMLHDAARRSVNLLAGTLIEAKILDRSRSQNPQKWDRNDFSSQMAIWLGYPGGGGTYWHRDIIITPQQPSQA